MISHYHQNRIYPSVIEFGNNLRITLNQTSSNNHYNETGTIFGDIAFIPDWFNTLGATFKLGQLSFTALAPTSATISASFIDVLNDTGNPITAQKVPEPSVIILFMLALFLLMHKRRV